MCLVEDDLPGYNLALGVSRKDANLHFMRACINRCIVTTDGKPLPKEVFDYICNRDTDEEFNQIFGAVFSEMFAPDKGSKGKN